MSNPDASIPQIFDRSLVRERRRRAADDFSQYSFLFDEVSERLIERLELIRRQYSAALIVGARTGGVAARLAGRFGIETLVQFDLEHRMLSQGAGLRVAGDEEMLPFADGSFDLVISPVSLHSVNDLPGALVQLRRVLRPDGLFLAAVYGLGSLAPLRDAFLAAESAAGAGSAPHVHPLLDVRDGGALLQRAGFALPVADAETIAVNYANPMRLLSDLRGMGEGNALYRRSPGMMRRQVLFEAMKQMQGVEVPFEIVFLTGWAPDSGQQQPLRPGQGKTSLASVLSTGNG